jgi:thioredoxin reductase (NADPH)
MMVAHSVARLDCEKRPYKVVLDNGNRLPARAVIIATGAQYNKPRIANLEQFEGQGIYYGATYMEAQLCEQEETIVVGGGNSAGQAAIFLSQTARKVYLLVRSDELSDTMSRYLVQRIQENPAIELHYKTQIVGLDGGTHLERVTWQDKSSVAAWRSMTRGSSSPGGIWITQPEPRRGQWLVLHKYWKLAFRACLRLAMFARVM